MKNLREPKRQLTEWDRNFIEPAEAIEWQDHGVFDVQVALKAKQLGLHPQRHEDQVEWRPGLAATSQRRVGGLDQVSAPGARS